MLKENNMICQANNQLNNLAKILIFITLNLSSLINGNYRHKIKIKVEIKASKKLMKIKEKHRCSKSKSKGNKNKYNKDSKEK